jgi:ribosome-associated heat shock protein Hsp15
VVPVAVRDRGTGRPTKRERRSIEKLLGRPTR